MVFINRLHRRYCAVLYRRAIAMKARKTLITVFGASNSLPGLHPEPVFVQVPIHQLIIKKNLFSLSLTFALLLVFYPILHQYSSYLVQTHMMHAAMVADVQLMDCTAVEDVLHIVHSTLKDHETYTDSCRVVVGMTMSSIPAM